MREERIQTPLKAGHNRPASATPFKLVFRWWANDGPRLNADLVAMCFSKGSRPVLLKNRLAFPEQVGGVRTPSPSPGQPPGQTSHAHLPPRIKHLPPFLPPLTKHPMLVLLPCDFQTLNSVLLQPGKHQVSISFQ